MVEIASIHAAAEAVTKASGGAVVQSPALQEVLSSLSAIAENSPGQSPAPVSQAFNSAGYLDRVQAERLAFELERVINSTYGTEVHFQVSLQDRGLNAIQFQVVDQRTGAVVREYPPHEAIRLAEQVFAPSGQGILLDTQG